MWDNRRPDIVWDNRRPDIMWDTRRPDIVWDTRRPDIVWDNILCEITAGWETWGRGLPSLVLQSTGML